MFSWFRKKPIQSPELKEAESVFSEEELNLIQKQFWAEIARQGGAGSGRAAHARDGALDTRHLGSLLGPPWGCLEPLIAAHLQLLLADRADGKIHLSGLIIAKARAERLGERTALKFSYRLLTADGTGAGYKALEAAVLSCLRLSSGSSNSSNAGDVQQHVAAVCRGALLHEASATPATAAGHQATAAATNPEDVLLSFDEYCKWTSKCPALHKDLCSLLRRIGMSDTAGTVATAGAPAPAAANCGSSTTTSNSNSERATVAAAAAAPRGLNALRLPVLLQLGKAAAGSTLLQPVWTWVLASRLPPAQRVEWRLLFTSQRDGKSFSTFFGRLSAAPGPTLLLLRDAEGALLGGYASQPWAKSGIYYGDVSSFIFSLLPILQVFPATGVNDNFQWCGVGFSQLPAGLGFGGAAAARGHFALYVEPSLDSGMSRPVATYGNTPLASEQIDAVECWLLQPPEGEQQPGDTAGGRPGGTCSAAGTAGGGGGGGSILGKAAEDRAILELAGLKMHSAGLRDEPLEE
ncbi:hypothetical protein VOLCADRAFT_116007 [Volvox carteri f. nagariensis]|uniref:TLDc domain-containing protein n=1 Tax=Volvox carteri f. nagariensis TaxID=3068 RepID=D8TJF5_VOLCA|nr:uncharacterized protein VOLCADRAFT_116007 [Volvox carteri f. nagariensis]EFJ52534.1 hypothetical protein VOLCADRAFT_116007 [Volvox carteri f. nagariensis]|eukprot:XP_002946607.1 hypothetical protein VOLCADRAFT_116007 [Volvox carteri f. nagariensis]